MRAFGYVSALILVYILCRYNFINKIYHRLITSIIHVVYLPWAIYCVINFYKSDNYTKEEAGFLYSGMLYLMIEGIILQLLWAIMLIVIIVLLIILFTLHRTGKPSNKEDYIQKVNLVKYIQCLDLLKLTAKRFYNMEICRICAEKFELNQKVVCLLWGDSHFFHKDCLFQWVEMSSSWPVWKADIIDEMLNCLGISEKTSSDKSNNVNYGGVKPLNAKLNWDLIITNKLKMENSNIKDTVTGLLIVHPPNKENILALWRI